MKNHELENRLSNLSEALERVKAVSATGIKRHEIRDFLYSVVDLVGDIGDHLFAVEDSVAAIDKLEGLVEEKNARIEELEGMVAEWAKEVMV